MSLETLKVASGGRYLQTESGRPFFYLGDTAWELFHRATREETDELLRDRSAKGFNVVQIVALPEFDGLRAKNAYGDLPFEGGDTSKPVEAYWSHVDWVVRRANELGIYVGLLPTWGDKWNKAWGVGPEIFTPENASAYGEWIGRRYGDAGVLWIMGGDRPIADERHLSTVRSMAEGVKHGSGGRQLVTFHPPGGASSSTFVNCESWLDFHMQQTGHSRSRESWLFHERDWALFPRRPFVNGEPPYEAHPCDFNSGDEGWLDHNDVRREFYWAFCGGAAGFAYGCHAVWQFYDSRYEPLNLPRTTWRESLSLPGSFQMTHGLKLALSRPFFEREPASGIVKSPSIWGPRAVRACKGSDGSWTVIYAPENQRVSLHPGALAAPLLRVSYFNPRSGETVSGGDFDQREGGFLQAPYDSSGRDWAILLDDPAKGYPIP